jgi:thiol-disulfide isomerase/thioredoxin
MPTARIAIARTDETDIVDWIQKVAATNLVKDFMLTVQAGNALLKRDLDEFGKYSIHVENEYLIDRLMQEYRTVRSNMLNPENISSSITGNPKDFTGNVAFEDKNVLAKLIAPNDGKVQIINISAAWCAPCHPVLDMLVSLREDYAGKNVCLSFICISPDKKETREMYREKGIDDTNVHFTTDVEYNFLAKTFSPMGFPYGILVNRKGVIVDYGMHVRPNLMLREKINLLLEQDKLIK